MTPRTLSSAQTFLSKFVFPAVWITGFGIATLSMWINPIAGHSANAASGDMRTQFLGFWIAGSAFILWLSAGLKRVRIDREFLYVSNYRREIAIPLSQIREVTENRWINTHPVTIHFRTITEFGVKITFMPTMRWFALWSSHPVVQELRSAASGQFTPGT